MPAPLFPVFLDLAGRRVLLVGGGAVARRKAEALLEAGARLVVGAPALEPWLARAAAEGRLEHRAGHFDPDWLEGVWLAIAATDDAAVNAAVAREAGARQIWVNVVDEAPRCSFQVPARIERGPLQIAISSRGEAPMLARWLRERLEAELDPGLGRLAEWLGSKRAALRARFPDPVRRRQVLEALLRGPASDALRRGDTAAAEQALDAAVDASSYARPAGNLEQLPQWSQMNEAERAQARRGDVTGAIAAMTRRLTGVSGFDSFTTPEGGENFDTRPEWAREAGIDLRTWTGMTPAAREEARQRHVAQSNQGWTLAGNIFNAASQITQSILGGNLQRDLAQIQAQAQTNSAAAQQAAAEFTARTNLQIAQMQLAAQQAAAQGNAGQAQQFQAAIAAMQAAQQEAQGRQESNLAAILGAMQQNQQRLSQPQGMSTGATLGLAAGVAALLAGGVYVATRKGK